MRIQAKAIILRLYLRSSAQISGKCFSFSPGLRVSVVKAFDLEYPVRLREFQTNEPD